MGREQVLRKLEKSWTEFKESYAGLTEEQMNMPGVIEEWSVKDIIAHVSVWEKETLKMLPLILNGSRTPRYSTTYGGIDAFNALKTEEQRSLSLREVQEDLEKTHESLIAYLQTLPEQALSGESRILRRLRLDTYGHYPIHTRAIQDWRSRNGL
ncbi:MAG TPA: DinB family protein [Anaerolineaceae bacterium]|nr:DinB family protein [Anaerolineaceae bacterium]